MNKIKNEIITALNTFRNFLHKHIILYGLLAGVGIVAFWKGTWGILTDLESVSPHLFNDISSSILGVAILLAIGIFASNFVGSDIVKKIEQEDKEIKKTELEIREEEKEIKTELKNDQIILNKLNKIEKELGGKGVIHKSNQKEICG